MQKENQFPLAPALRDVVEFRASLFDESDRGVVLACAAYLDGALLDLLKKSFIDVRPLRGDAVKDLKKGTIYEGNGPLCSFSSRIDIALLMGLIPSDFHAALHSIRRMRNDFAHKHRVTSLSAQAYSDRCKNLLRFHGNPDETSPREILVGSVMAIFGFIHLKTDTTKQAKLEATNIEQAGQKSRELLSRMFQQLGSQLPQDPGTASSLAIPAVSPEMQAFMDSLLKILKAAARSREKTDQS